MIKRLELNYFKKHEHLEVDFLNGLNGITGKNYHGKSTILQGVLFCLGGSRMVPGNRVATRGTNSGFKQRLWFAIAGKGDYFIERTKTSANLYRECSTVILNPHPGATPTRHEEGTVARDLVASGAGPVNNAVAELIGMPLRRFAQIKYTKAKAADAILKYGSTELFKIITEITGLSRITEVLDRITADLGVQRKLQEVLTVTDMDDRSERLKQLTADLLKAGEEVGARKASVASLAVKRGELDKEERALRDSVSNLFGLQRDHQRAGEQVDLGVEQLLAQAKEAATLAERRAALGEGDVGAWSKEREVLAHQERASRALSGEVAALTKEAEQLAERGDAYKEAHVKAKDALAATPAADPGAVKAASDALNALKEKRVEAQHALEHAKSVLTNGACPTCKREFEGFNYVDAGDDLVAAQAAFNAVVKEIAAAGEVLSDAMSAAQKVADAEQLLQRRTLALSDYQAMTAKTQHNLAVKAKELAAAPSADTLRTEIDALEGKIMQARQLASDEARNKEKAAEAQALLDKYRPLKEAAAADMEALLADNGVADRLQLESKLAGKQTELGRLNQRLVDESTALDDQVARHNRLETETRMLEAEINRITQDNHRAREVHAKAGKLEELQRFIRDNRDRYSKQAWDVFMASASMFASSATGGAIESISRSDDGAFTFIEDSFEMTLDEASGAQQAIIGTAVQMALAEAAQSPLDLLLMDEPTADMDPEHALAFSTLLAASGKQVVMVTHRELDSSVFNNAISL